VEPLPAVAPRVPRLPVLSPVLGLAATWVAAGSVGLFGHPLRHALTFLLLSAASIVGLSTVTLDWSRRRVLTVAIFAVVAGFLSASPQAPLNVGACAVVLATLAWAHAPDRRASFLIAALVATAFALYRFGLVSVPWLWLLADAIGGAVSGVAGFLCRSPLNTGATFAGLDYLFVTGAVYAIWIVRQAVPRRRALGVIGIILAVHFIYLTLLAWSPRLLTVLPTPAAAAEFGTTAPWDPIKALRSFLPWNVPVLAALLHAGLVAWLLRSLPSLPRSKPSRVWLGSWAPVGVIVGAALLPVITSLGTRTLSLEGKKIVLFEKGFLNWMKPKHGEYGRLSVGMYGTLPAFFQNYGANCIVSPDLSEADLRDADVVALIFPNKPWEPGQLERVLDFARRGGSLLVLGEHTVLEKEGGNRFNDALKPTAMRVAFDSATFEIGGWLESYEALAHPAQAGLTDERNQFGVVIGASVETRWPARPILAGRWGYNDPGDATNDEKKGGSMMGNHRYDPGEKLGDLILASEQKFGKGRIVAFGDTSGFSNSILFGSHDYVARLFAYLATPAQFPMLRLWAAVLIFLLLMVLVWSLLTPVYVLSSTVAFAMSAMLCTSITHKRAEVLPDGRHQTPNRLAYVDQSHLERHSSESWRPNGVGGLQMTLMRDDYIVLGMHRFDPRRLERAGLLVSIAPSRKFDADEKRALQTFIENGGIFICTVGYPESAPSRDMLAQFGFYVGGPGAADGTGPEPKPYGHFKAPYFNGGDYMAYVRFHAAWTVDCFDSQAQPIAYGPRDPKGPPDQRDPTVIVLRRIGRGKMVVVADTDFATNQNLEREGGEPFEGMRENADFWRWLISYLNDQPVWRPPKPAPPPPASPPASQ
jgi:hypothetical protein